MRLLELADAPAVGPRKRPSLVAEQFALQERLGNGRAVDGQEGGSAAAAVMVDGASDQFLARAAFPQDQHVHILRSHAADLLADGLHGRAAADQPIGLVLGTVAVFKDHGHVHQRLMVNA